MKSSISVVIPAFNEEQYIEATLSSLKNQTISDFELIIVDNNSTDNTSSVAKRFGGKVIKEEKKGLSYARQSGFAIATGEIIVTTDADAYITDSRWLEKILTKFSRDDQLVGYGGLFRLYSGPLTARIAVRYGEFPLYCIGRIFSGKWMLIGPNFAVRKSAFMKTGGFSAGLPQGEDIDIAFKLSKIGKVVLDPSLIVYCSGRRFRKGLIAGIFSYGAYWLLKVIFGRSTTKRLEDIRE